LPYYEDSNGNRISLPSHDSPAPDGSAVYHDGVVLMGLTEEGVPNEKIIDAATYYLGTFDWGNDAWNDVGAVYDNDYIKMREAVLSYTLSAPALKKLKLQHLRISVFGRNLLYLWRTLENLDPESTIGTSWLNQGIDEGSSAATRSYGFMLNIGF
jgi:iron complex outermembrane receptor protein